MRRDRRARWFLLLFLLIVAPRCQRATEPSHVHFIVLKGSAYERGFTYGKRFAAETRGLYTRLLSDSIFPFLNREQISIAPILRVYGQPEYLDGSFAYLMLLASGRHLYESYLPESMRDELRGMSEGSGIPLDEIIVLNTFVDTMMAFRAVVVFIKHIQTPHIQSLTFEGGIDADGLDNDRDGETDENNEGLVSTLPTSRTLMEDVPPDATLRIVWKDESLGGLACPDPRNIDPIGDMLVEARCVDDACVRPDCLGESRYPRECFNETALACIEPRLLGDCFDQNCMEVADPGCVNLESIRVQLADQLYVSGDPALAIAPLEDEGADDNAIAASENPHELFCQEPIEVRFAPPGGFPAGTTVSVKLQAGDRSPVYSPPPFHHRTMRAEWVSFATVAPELAPADPAPHCAVGRNIGFSDPGSQPAGLAFAARGSATASGEPLLAHHFALLDANVAHEHTAVILHLPNEGHPHVTIGWTGLIWGFSGMNDEGLTYAVNPSDSLDNPLIGGMLEDIRKPENLIALLASPDLEGLAKVLKDRELLSSGIPIGMLGRMLLTEATTVEEARQRLYGHAASYGWNVLLADATGAIAAVELDSAVQSPPRAPSTPYEDTDGFQTYDPDDSRPANLDACGDRWASVGPDDLRIASHFRKNAEDLFVGLGPFTLYPQRHWTGFYYRSVRTFHLLGDAIAERLGKLDAESAIDILRQPELADQRDSMNAVVFEPSRRLLRWAMGEVPATDGPFFVYDLRVAIEEATR